MPGRACKVRTATTRAKTDLQSLTWCLETHLVGLDHQSLLAVQARHHKKMKPLFFSPLFGGLCTFQPDLERGQSILEDEVCFCCTDFRAEQLSQPDAARTALGSHMGSSKSLTN